MIDLPKRKPIRIENYDYSTPGAYFITVCTANREKIFWSDRRGELCSPANVPLSDIGMIVDNEIKKLNSVYDAVRVDKYCIMPDHPIKRCFGCTTSWYAYKPYAFSCCCSF